MSVMSRVREYRNSMKAVKLWSPLGAAVVLLFVMLAVAAGCAAVDGSYVQSLVLVAMIVVAAGLFRITTRDETYDRYVTATEVLDEMTQMVMELESEGIPIEGKHGEDFYRLFTAAQGRASKGSRLTREDMDFVALNTALAHTALESHAAVESVEEN